MNTFFQIKPSCGIRIAPCDPSAGDGRDEDTDREEALKLLLEAADLGNPVAMLRLFKVFSNEELGVWSIS